MSNDLNLLTAPITFTPIMLISTFRDEIDYDGSYSAGRKFCLAIALAVDSLFNLIEGIAKIALAIITSPALAFDSKLPLEFAAGGCIALTTSGFNITYGQVLNLYNEKFDTSLNNSILPVMRAISSFFGV